MVLVTVRITKKRCQLFFRYHQDEGYKERERGKN